MSTVGDPASDADVDFSSSDNGDVVCRCEVVDFDHPLAGLDLYRCNSTERERAAVIAIQAQASHVVCLDGYRIGTR